MTSRIKDELSVLQAMKAEQDKKAEDDRSREQHAKLLAELTPEQLAEFNRRLKCYREEADAFGSKTIAAVIIAAIVLVFRLWWWPIDEDPYDFYDVDATIVSLLILTPLIFAIGFSPGRWWPRLPRWPFRRQS